MTVPSVKEPSDTDPGTSAKWGAPDAVQLVTIIKGTHASERVPIAAIEGTAVSLSAVQTITGAKTFNDQKLLFFNPAGTFAYTVVTSAIAAARNITLPLLAASDTFVFENHTQTLTNKTISAASNTLTGVARTDVANTFADANNTFRSSRLLLTNPANSFNYIFVGAAIAADRNITLPLLTGNDTLVTANFAQTLTGKTIGDSSDPTKAFVWTLSGATTAKTLTFISAHTDDRSITLPDATTTLVGTDTTDALSNKTLTAPKFADLGFIADANGNELLILDTVASAVNEIKLANGATGVPASIIASGETNIGILFAGKGTGKIAIGDGADNTKLVNFDIVGATTAKTATLTFVHTTDIAITFPNASVTLASLTGTETFTNKTLTAPKFADLGFIADANGNELIILDTVASAVNEVKLANAVTTAYPTLTASGDDTDVGIQFVPKGAGYVFGNMETLVIAIGDETTAITTGTAKVTFRMPYAFKVNKVKASLTTASSSGNPAFDINEGGVSILSTTITIDANELTSATAATPAVISDSALADDAEITIDIDTAGTGAKGAKIYLIGYATAKPA